MRDQDEMDKGNQARIETLFGRGVRAESPDDSK